MKPSQPIKRPITEVSHPSEQKSKSHAPFPTQFTNGSSVSFAFRKQAIIDQFRLENVWDLVRMPQINPGAPVVIVESIVESVAPNLNYVATRMADYNQRTLDLFNAQEARIIANHPGNENMTAAGLAVTAARRGPRMLNLQSRDERQIKGDEREHEFEKHYNSLITKHQREVKEFKAKQATCLGVFHKMLSEGVRSRVSELLNEDRFREAWYRLCELYSPTAGGQATIQSVIEYFQKYVWTQGTIIDHIEVLHKLSTQCASAGVIHTDASRLYNLYRSVEESEYTEYNDLISICRTMNFPLDDVENRLIQRFAELETRKDTNDPRDKLKNVSINEVSADPRVPKKSQVPKKNEDSKKTCDNCGRTGHEEKDCYRLQPCIFCQKSHNPLYCKENPDRGNLVKLREARKAKESSTVPKEVESVGEPVNLVTRFQSLNPRPK
jgi:hypothetical protein